MPLRLKQLRHVVMHWPEEEVFVPLKVVKFSNLILKVVIWEQAVNETRGKVVYANGGPFSTWYASTSGGYQKSYSSNGYSTPGFWDTSCDNQGCWTGEAWEKKADSPWFTKVGINQEVELLVEDLILG